LQLRNHPRSTSSPAPLIAHMARLLLFACLVVALFSDGLAEGVDTRNDLLPVLKDDLKAGRRLQNAIPGSWVSPNPPSCVVDLADLLASLVGAVQALIGSMIACPPVFAEGITYAEQQRLCALPILNFLTFGSDAVADVEGAAFDCFNQNQACGQAISFASGDLLDVAIAITAVIDLCPFTVNEDGFTCWARIWNIVQLLVEAAKYIDVALATCPITENLSEPKPEGPAPEPTKSDKAAAPAPSADKAAADTGGKDTDKKLFAASWAMAAGPSARFRVHGIERRLAEKKAVKPGLLQERLLKMKQGANSTTLLDSRAKVDFADVLIEVLTHFRHAYDALPTSGPLESRDLEHSMKKIKAMVLAKAKTAPVSGNAGETVVV